MLIGALARINVLPTREPYLACSLTGELSDRQLHCRLVTIHKGTASDWRRTEFGGKPNSRTFQSYGYSKTSTNSGQTLRDTVDLLNFPTIVTPRGTWLGRVLPTDSSRHLVVWANVPEPDCSWYLTDSVYYFLYFLFRV